MLKLYAVVLGGRAEGCNVELHDVVFVIGHSLEDTYTQLTNKWFGIKQRLHIDSFVELKYVDGYEVTINKNPPTDTTKKLFFVNFGGYKEGYLGEIHEINFYVADSKPDVLKRAKQELGLTLVEPHCDDNVIIDDIIAIERAHDCYIHLTPSAKPHSLKIESRYAKL